MGMIGRNVEVYMDNILVKSDSCNQFIKDLEEVFRALRRTNMWLNLEKCAFGGKGEVPVFQANPPGDRG